MKITIDTKQDSRDEIIKVINLLRQITGLSKGSEDHDQMHSYSDKNKYDDSSSSVQSQNQEGFFNMFDATPSQETQASESTSSQQSDSYQYPEEPKKTEEKKDKDADFEIYEY